MKIPKRMSFFWGGGSLSWMRWLSFYSFRLLNPDWEIYLYIAPTCENKRTWSSREQQDCEPAYGGPNYFDRVAACGVKIEGWQPPVQFAAASPVHMADLCRWAVLSQYGGWFADTDMLFVDSMTRIEERHEKDLQESIHAARDAEVAIPLCRDWIPTGLMGAVKGNRFTSDLYAAGRAKPDFTRYHSAGRDLIAKFCGLDPVMAPERRQVIRGLKTGFPGCSFYIMHHLTAYRWEWFDANRIFDCDEEVFPDTIAIHWYGGSRAGQKFNRVLDEHNFRGHQNTFCHYAANLLDGKCD